MRSRVGPRFYFQLLPFGFHLLGNPTGGAPTAIDHQRVTIDHSGGARGQPNHGLRDIFGRADTTNRNDVRPIGFVTRVVVHIAFVQRRTDPERIDRDAVRSEFATERLRHVNQTGLGDAIRREFRNRLNARDGGRKNNSLLGLRREPVCQFLEAAFRSLMLDVLKAP